jgi:glycosyltransferase involved in cell wall biosynthesis
MLKKNLVIALYSPPDYYPPTLSAVEALSAEYENIYIIYRNYDGTFDWKYPGNVYLVPTGKRIGVREAEMAGINKKIRFFLQYSRKLISLIKTARPDTILLYDFMPVGAYRMARHFTKASRILWYHNHDVGDESMLRKWSIGWLAWRSEKWIFPKLNIFSLPSIDRKKYFPMDLLKGKFFFLPNYPSLKVFSRFKNIQKPERNPLKIVFQGSISPMHGLEEIIALLNESVNGKGLQLILRGMIDEEYKKELIGLAGRHAVLDKLFILDPTSYGVVIEKSIGYHVGVGIYRRADIMNSTMATASNKIYEYAACGLPVLLYDNDQFRKNLGDCAWAFFTDCSQSSLLNVLEEIDSNFDALSTLAKRDFAERLNFEKYFKPLCDSLKQ